MVSTVRLKKYQRLLRQLFPKGKAWEAIEDQTSDLRKLLDSLGNEACRVEERSLQLVEESDPRTTSEMLPDWERLLALPDECEQDPASLTIQERRDRLVQVLTTQGGQYPDFYKRLAENFGFDTNIIDVQDQPPFQAGRARAGDRLTNGDWIFTFIVELPATESKIFRAGDGRAGDPLRFYSNPTLECLFNKHKPAHTIVIFSFGGI